MHQQLLGPSCDPVAAVHFIWEGQEGLGETAYEPWRREHRLVEEALQEIPGARFFAPILRRASSPGGKRDDCTPEANVVWIDYDASDGLEFIERELVPRGLEPSVVISSGRGFWIYLKLDGLIPLDEIESINRGIATLAAKDDPSGEEKGGDRGSPCGASTLARCPGSLNDKYDPPRSAWVVSMDGTAIYSPEDLEELRGLDPKRNKSRRSPGQSSSDRPSTAFPTWNVIDRPLDLRRDHPVLWNYIQTGKASDRSAAEMSIALLLLRYGHSDASVRSFFEKHRLAGYMEEDDPLAYLALTLARAKGFLEESDRDKIVDSSSSSSMSCHPAGTKTPESTSHAGSVDRLALLLFIGGQTHKELVSLVTERFDVSEATAERVISDLASGGAIYRRRTGKPPTWRYYVDTRKCERLLKPWSLPRPRFLGGTWWIGEVPRLLYPKQHEEVRRRGERARKETVDAV